MFTKARRLLSPSPLAQVRSLSRPARLFLLATVIDGIVYSIWNLFFNFYILERGFDREFLGLVNSMPAVAILALGIPMGLLSDRIGRKRSMIAGVAASLVLMAVQVTAQAPALILTAAFLNGVVGGLYYLSHAPFMMKVSTSENRTMLFSLNFGLITLAGVFGNALAGRLPALFASWMGVPADGVFAYRSVLLASVGLSAFALIPLALIHEPRRGAAAVPTAGRSLLARFALLRQVIFRPLTIKLALPNLLIGTGAAILIPYMNVFFKDRFALADQRLGLLFSLAALLTALGSVVAPRLAERLGGKIGAVVLTQTASLLFLLVMGFVPSLWPVMLAFLLRGMLMNMAVPLYSAFAMESTPESEQGTVNSVKEIAWQIGWAVGPFASGLIQQAYGFTPLFIATWLLYVLAIIATWIFFWRGEQDAVYTSRQTV